LPSLYPELSATAKTGRVGQTEDCPVERTLCGHLIGLVVGAYGELVYLSTVLGGWIADRLLGNVALAIVPGLAGVGLGLVMWRWARACSNGFTLFYLGINLGAFIGPLITGLLQSRVGFHYGFGAAAIGMALGVTLRRVPPQPG